MKIICPVCGKPLGPEDVNTKCEGSLLPNSVHPIIVAPEFKDPWASNHDEVQRAATEE